MPPRAGSEATLSRTGRLQYNCAFAQGVNVHLQLCDLTRRSVMRLMRRPLAAALILLFGVFSLVPPGGRAQGQSISPNAEQLDIFKTLTPEQQDAVLRALGGSGSGALGGSLGGL